MAENSNKNPEGETQVRQEEGLNLFILNYLRGIGANQVAHELEKFSKCFFDGEYFNERIGAGDWKSVVEYVSSFVDWEESQGPIHSLLFDVYKQQILELFLRGEEKEVENVLEKELNGRFSEEKVKEIIEIVKDNENGERIKQEWKGEEAERNNFIEESKPIIQFTVYHAVNTMPQLLQMRDFLFGEPTISAN
eukprot:TRINITY_DN7024_c1_g1_i2.p1 TRINITY_DN7024_c1_g1~~TRINITY_DN7024_c1_g1_i2.p1  ORF type:complete len:193 (-),score=59.00 TRINITY_DN7024_c1_g1_i2:29-607(-)